VIEYVVSAKNVIVNYLRVLCRLLLEVLYFVINCWPTASVYFIFSFSLISLINYCRQTFLGSMIIKNTWHPLTIWQCKGMLRVARALLPLAYLTNVAISFMALGLATRHCQLEALGLK
jgi:hypothetical protein